MGEVLLSILAMLLVAGALVWRAIQIARRLGRPLNFRSLLLYNYTLTSLLSGVVHLATIPGSSRGYFDASTSPHALGVATIGSLLGAIVMLLVSGWRTYPREDAPSGVWSTAELQSGDRLILWTAGLSIAPVAISSTLTLAHFVDVEGLTRVISLSNGLARLNFLSNWMAWSLTFTAIALAWGPLRRHPIATTALLGAVLVGIALSVQWTGGRSIVLVFALPITLILWPLLRGHTAWLFLPAAVAGLVLYLVQISNSRFAMSSSTSSLATWLDWEWGRFSMLGFGGTYVQEYGFLYGETLLARGLDLVTGVLRFFGFQVHDVAFRDAMDISGSFLLRSGEQHVVPGFVAEWYLNFGMVGIVVGVWVLTRLVALADDAFAKAKSPVTAVAFAYLGTLLVFRTLQSAFGTLASYLLFSGLPVLAVAAVSVALRASEKRRYTGPEAVVGLRRAPTVHHST